MIPLDEQIKCVERELALRLRVYPKWIKDGRMNEATADKEFARMQAVHRTLTILRRRLDSVDSVATEIRRMIA